MLIAACALALAPATGALAQQAKEGAPKQAKQAKKAKQTAPAPKQAAMVMDANTGKVLHNDEGDVQRFPASLTKMMTLYMLFGEIEQGRLNYRSTITLSARAAGAAPSKLDLKAGEQIQVLDAIKALVVKSANDIAIAVAEHIGGSEPAFARMMTDRARQIGMRSTQFRNASGLPDPGQLSTARDMLILALRLQDDYPQHYRLFATQQFDFRGKSYRSHNALLRNFPGMDGIKTGYTRASGFNLVSSVRTGDKHVVAAVFGGKTAQARNAHMRMLLFRGLEQASTTKTRDASRMLVASQRPARPAAPAEAELAWATEMKAPPAPKPVKKAPAPIAAKKLPPPAAPAPAPVPRPVRHDAIAEVLAQGDDAGSDTETASVAMVQPRLDLDGLRAAMSNAEAEGTPRPAQTARASANPDIGSLIRNSLVEGTPMPAPVARAPSTLDRQAVALATPPQPVQPAPRPVAAAPAGGGFEVQIGAYGSAEEAQSKLNIVRSRASGLLEGHNGVTLPFQNDKQQFFRARFVNFSEQAASNTCLELRRLAIDCFVMRAE